MTEAQDAALLRAERTIEYIIRTRGHSSPEYFRALRDYQARLHLTMASAEMETVPQAAAPSRHFAMKRPA